MKVVNKPKNKQIIILLKICKTMVSLRSRKNVNDVRTIFRTLFQIFSNMFLMVIKTPNSFLKFKSGLILHYFTQNQDFYVLFYLHMFGLYFVVHYFHFTQRFKESITKPCILSCINIRYSVYLWFYLNLKSVLYIYKFLYLLIAAMFPETIINMCIQ